MSSHGFFRMPRKDVKEMENDPVRLALWAMFLSRARFNGEMRDGKLKVQLKKGEFVFGISKIAEDWDLDIKVVRKEVRELESSGRIKIHRKDSHGCIASINDLWLICQTHTSQQEAHPGSPEEANAASQDGVGRDTKEGSKGSKSLVSKVIICDSLSANEEHANAPEGSRVQRKKKRRTPANTDGPKKPEFSEDEVEFKKRLTEQIGVKYWIISGVQWRRFFDEFENLEHIKDFINSVLESATHSKVPNEAVPKYVLGAINKRLREAAGEGGA